MFLNYSLGLFYGAHSLFILIDAESLKSQKYTAWSIYTVVFSTIIIELNMSPFQVV